MAAKTKEVNALIKTIEEKIERSGALGVEIQEMKNDLGDTAERLEEDKKFLADLDKNCELKQQMHDEMNADFKEAEMQKTKQSRHTKVSWLLRQRK